MNEICKTLKYLTDNNAYLFIDLNEFLKGLDKTNKELSGLLIWLDENDLIKFDSTDFRRLHAKHAGIERGLNEFRIRGKLTDKGERYYKDNCREVNTLQPGQPNEIPKKGISKAEWIMIVLAVIAIIVTIVYSN